MRLKLSKRVAAVVLGAGAFAFGLVGVASAHVTVKPGDVLTGSFQTFTVSVPVEKPIGTIAVKLDIPADLGHVTPTVKPGWNIQVDKQGEGEKAVAKSITWSGNEIGAGYRDDFTFSARTPDKPVELQWKAYQTYADGSVVEWSLTEAQQPKKADGSPDFSKSGPFSVTKVATESAADTALNHAHMNAHDAQNAANRAMYAAIGGIVLGFIALYLATKQPQKPGKEKL